MKYLLIIFIVLFSTQAFADYAVEKEDGSVIILDENVSNDLGKVLKDMGLDGLPIIRIKPSDLPDPSDRKYWTFNPVPVGKKISINQVLKNEDDSEKNKKDSETDAILSKLKISRDEAKKLKDVINGD